ncbi:nuclear transport factor 2 family protein [Nocardioides sp.]|uniref:nuclear transport factor 2 family protein n=1 Tax=Nocardioides sp. TaxID=35761 RepID=UPI002ED10FEE
MADHVQAIRDYWDTAERRDWDGFAATLSPDVVYDLPQTRERVIGRDRYLTFNREYPGDWHVAIRRVVTDDAGGVAWTDVRVGDEHVNAIHFFTFDDAGLITRVDDFWPEPYDPPPGREHLVERY